MAQSEGGVGNDKVCITCVLHERDFWVEIGVEWTQGRVGPRKDGGARKNEGCEV